MKKRDIALLALISALMACMVVYTDICIESVKSSLSSFLNIVFPSVFPFMAASGMLTRTGALSSVFSSFKKARYLPNFIYVFICSFFSSYPNGVKISCELYKNGAVNEAQARHGINSTSLCGIAFLSGAVGLNALGNSSLAFYLILAQTLCALIIAVITSKRFPAVPPLKQSALPSALDALGGSIRSAFTVCAFICGYMVFFSVISDILCAKVFYSPSFAAFRPLLKGLLEMSSGCAALAQADISLTAKAVTASFLTSFGGVSVLMQSFAIMNAHNIKNRRFIACKLLQGLLSALLTYIFMLLFATQSVSVSFAQSPQSNIPLSISIITVCSAVMLLCLALKKRTGR